MMRIVRDISETEWKQFLDSCSEATLYHTPEWKKFLEKTFGYKPYYLFATDECGQMTGLLPLFNIKSRLTGNRLCSVPFSHKCGCLGEDDVCVSLLDEALLFQTAHGIEQIEIRDTADHHQFQESNTFCTHILELSQNPEDTWKRLDKGSVRWAVKKSDKRGVSVLSSTNHEDIKAFYDLNCMTKQNLGVPCHPWEFFNNLFSLLGGYVRLYIAQYGGETIAGGVMEFYKDQVLYGYGAANPEYLKIHPYNAFIWKSIEDACAEGYCSYDFGRTSYSNTGLMQFKKKWGTQEYTLCYSFSPYSRKSGLNDRESRSYQFGNAVIRAMPKPVYMKFSKTVFSHFG